MILAFGLSILLLLLGEKLCAPKLSISHHLHLSLSTHNTIISFFFSLETELLPNCYRATSLAFQGEMH